MNAATQRFLTYSQWVNDPASVVARPPMPTYEELSMIEFPTYQPERHTAFHVTMAVLGVFTLGLTWLVQIVFGIVQMSDNWKKAKRHAQWVQQSREFARYLATTYEDGTAIR